MDIQIRAAKPEDLPAILAIYSPYIQNTCITFEYSVPGIEEFQERYDRITAHFSWLVCEIDGIIAGYAYAEKVFGREAYQWDADSAVYVDERFQRRGVAQSLYRCLEGILQMQGFFNLYALVTSDNEKSKRFHERMGYEETAYFKKTGYKFGRWLDVTWYVKPLQEQDVRPFQTVPFHQLETESVSRLFREEECKIKK